jgi:hypothetical protein
LLSSSSAAAAAAAAPAAFLSVYFLRVFLAWSLSPLFLI